MIAVGEARVIMASTSELVARARDLHQCSPTATAALGRVLTGAALMGALLKSERDVVSLRVDGGGPGGPVQAIARADGTVKGLIRNPQADLPIREKDGKLDVGGLLGKNGSLVVTKDMGLKEPYVGRCDLVSGEIGEDLATYFVQSEQTPSVVSVGVLLAGNAISAGGLIVQAMPQCSEEVLEELELRAPVMGDISRNLIEFDGPMGLMRAMFRGMEPQVLTDTPVAWKCDCSPERVAAALVTLGPDELLDMAQKDHGAEVGCPYCNTKYRFSEKELEHLAEEARGSRKE